MKRPVYERPHLVEFVRCPRCGSEPHQECVSRTGRVIAWGNYVHMARYDLMMSRVGEVVKERKAWMNDAEYVCPKCGWKDPSKQPVCVHCGEPTREKIKDTGTPAKKLDPKLVAKALGADLVGPVSGPEEGLALMRERRNCPIMVRLLDRANEKLIALENDLEEAAGECLVDVPEPGTDMAKLLVANRLMARRIENLESALDAEEKKWAAEIKRMEAALEDLHRDVDTTLDAQNKRHVKELDKRGEQIEREQKRYAEAVRDMNALDGCWEKKEKHLRHLLARAETIIRDRQPGETLLLEEIEKELASEPPKT